MKVNDLFEKIGAGSYLDAKLVRDGITVYPDQTGSLPRGICDWRIVGFTSSGKTAFARAENYADGLPPAYLLGWQFERKWPEKGGRFPQLRAVIAEGRRRIYLQYADYEEADQKKCPEDLLGAWNTWLVRGSDFLNKAEYRSLADDARGVSFSFIDADNVRGQEGNGLIRALNPKWCQPEGDFEEEFLTVTIPGKADLWRILQFAQQRKTIAFPVGYWDNGHQGPVSWRDMEDLVVRRRLGLSEIGIQLPKRPASSLLAELNKLRPTDPLIHHPQWEKSFVCTHCGWQYVDVDGMVIVQYRDHPVIARVGIDTAVLAPTLEGEYDVWLPAGWGFIAVGAWEIHPGMETEGLFELEHGIIIPARYGQQKDLCLSWLVAEDKAGGFTGTIRMTKEAFQEV